MLTEVAFEVIVKDKEVELKGTVKNLQTTAIRADRTGRDAGGVERVTDSIQMNAE